VAGCAVLTRTPPRRLPPPAGAAGPPAVEDGYEDRVGVIHVHTTYSHDAHGTFEEVVRTANAEALDFVITTEHNHLQALRDGRQGWHGAVLVLIGVEISTKAGHYLALNVTEEIDRHALTAQQIINEVNRQGGLGFIAHPYFKKAPWRDYTVTGFTGIEAYNVAHDTIDENKLRLALWTLTAPIEPFYFSILDRPYDPLAKWDALIRQHGKVVGIGATDAHVFKLAGLHFAGYDIMFQMARTHVLTPPGALTPEMVYDALRQGHAYVAVELLVEAKGFVFAAESPRGIIGIMGDEVPLEPELRLTASLPAAAQMALFRDGRSVADMTGMSWQIPVEKPGAYRLEASRHGKPWIISNPIYVRPALEAPAG
jgi:hypothetical protein